MSSTAASRRSGNRENSVGVGSEEEVPKVAKFAWPSWESWACWRREQAGTPALRGRATAEDGQISVAILGMLDVLAGPALTLSLSPRKKR